MSTKGSLATIYLSGFAINVEYAILMPTLWSYLQSLGGSQLFLGVALSLFSVTRTFMFQVVGTWMDHSGYRIPFLASYTLGMIGNLLYGVAGYAKSPLLILLGRFIAGLGAGTDTLNISYISENKPHEHTKNQIAILQGIRVVGMGLGPAFNILFTKLNVEFAFIQLNVMTIAGYFTFVLNLVLFILTLVFFAEPESERVVRIHSLSENEIPLLLNLSREEKSVSEKVYDMWISKGGIALLMAQFLIGFSIGSIDTYSTPIGQEQWNWSALENSIYFSALSGSVIIGVLITIFTSNNLSNLVILCCSMLGYQLSAVLGVFAASRPLISRFWFIAINMLISVSFPIVNSSSTAIYANLTPSGNRGSMIGASQMIFSFGCVLGPIYSAALLSNRFILFIGELCLVEIASLLLALFYKSLKNADISSTSSTRLLLQSSPRYDN